MNCLSAIQPNRRLNLHMYVAYEMYTKYARANRPEPRMQRVQMQTAAFTLAVKLVVTQRVRCWTPSMYFFLHFEENHTRIFPPH